MKPTQIIGDCELYLGDCMDVLPDLGGIDACITDPPYGIEDIVGGYGRGGKHRIANDKTLDVCHAAINAAAKVIENGWIAAFYSCKVTPSFMDGAPDGYFGEIIWDKKAPGLGGGFRYQHENIALFKIGAPEPLKPGFSVISDCRNPDLHPHQKPHALMTKILDIVHGDMTVDPFMGSGSTGVACAKMGRKFIGIEMEERYFDIACRRIEEAYKQPDLFVEQPKKQIEQEATDL